MTSVGTHTYQWDAEGRMKSVDGVAGQACQSTWTACFTYNALGERVEKQAGTAYSEYVYNTAGQVIAVNDRTSWAWTFFPRGAAPLALWQGNTAYFVHGNALGSNTFLSNYAGTVTQKEAFYPWGQRWATAGTVTDERFASLGRRDSETSLDPTLFRMFSSTQGRWLSPDPLGGSVFDPQSLNRYAYVLNNPTNFIDPRGDCFFLESGSVSPFTASGTGTPPDILCPRRRVPPDPDDFPPPGGGGGGATSGTASNSANPGGTVGPGNFPCGQINGDPLPCPGDDPFFFLGPPLGVIYVLVQVQAPSRSQKFASCVEANRFDNALRSVASAYDLPILNAVADQTLTSSAAQLQFNVTSALVTGQLGGNLIASLAVPFTHRGPIHATSFEHSAGSLLSRATGSPIFGNIGKLLGRAASGAAAVIVVAEGAFNGAAIARCAVVSGIQ